MKQKHLRLVQFSHLRKLVLRSTLEGSLEEKQINNTHKWLDVAPQRYSSLENSKTHREAFMIPDLFTLHS